MVCDTRKRGVVVLPCAHLVLCRRCTVEGMVCPHCKKYVVGWIEVLYDDDSLMTLR